MRITQAPSTARAAYYDRNMTYVSAGSDQQGIAPHAFADTWSYTVPAARKTTVTAVVNIWRRLTAAAPVGKVTAQVISAGGTAMFDYFVTTLNAIDNRHDAIITPNHVLIAGQIIKGNNSDASTGGTCDFEGWFNGNEYDA